MTKETPEQRHVDQQQSDGPEHATDNAATHDPVADDARMQAMRDAVMAEQETDVGPAGAPGGEDPAQLVMLLEDARARADQTHDQLLRARAEMENMARRQAKELENAHKFALDNFVRELLPVRDSLELGLSAATGAELTPEQVVGKLREGTELTLKLLGDAMGKFGIERLDPEGEPFNPAFHQAMSMQPRADVAPNTVVAVIQRGYTLNGRLVRPALVMVSRAA